MEKKNKQPQEIDKPDESTSSGETISREDFLTLELAKKNMMLASSQVEKSLAKNDVAAWSHKYMILRLSIKYKLSDGDEISSEDGSIIRKEKVTI